ncbi:hypothetical protein F4776DRAFT_379867 [Hypoxylon sp. NC0597]|nr:hypothetical protein F4776DRAFT_379867 [Hypoxylon sp. NC0597]
MAPAIDRSLATRNSGKTKQALNPIAPMFRSWIEAKERSFMPRRDGVAIFQRHTISIMYDIVNFPIRRRAFNPSPNPSSYSHAIIFRRAFLYCSLSPLSCTPPSFAQRSGCDTISRMHS